MRDVGAIFGYRTPETLAQRRHLLNKPGPLTRHDYFKSPLRSKFFGGGTDYPEYFLSEADGVATAIDKYCHITASRFQATLRLRRAVSYRKVEIVPTVSELEHNVFRECLNLCTLAKDIELHAVADLPAFTGLGSSSTFTVSLLHARYTVTKGVVSPLTWPAKPFM